MSYRSCWHPLPHPSAKARMNGAPIMGMVSVYGWATRRMNGAPRMGMWVGHPPGMRGRSRDVRGVMVGRSGG